VLLWENHLPNNYLNVLPKYRNFLCFAPRLPHLETCVTLPKCEILHPRAKIVWSYLAPCHGWLLSCLLWLESLKVLEPLRRIEDDLSPPPPHRAWVSGTSIALPGSGTGGSGVRSRRKVNVIVVFPSQGYKSKDFLRWEQVVSLHASCTATLSYPIFLPKLSTHHMYALDQLFHTYGPKVFTDNQMSWIKYIYYINNVSKD
jgi:hypothetical protein